MRHCRTALVLAALIAALPGCDPTWGVPRGAFPNRAGGIEVLLGDDLVAEGARIEGAFFGAPERRPYAILWIDSLGRVCSYIHGKARAEDLGFRMPVVDPAGCSGRIMGIDLIRPERRATARFIIKPSPDEWAGFPLVADPAGPVSGPAEWMRYRKLGARFAVTDVDSARQAAYAGLRPLPFEILPERDTLHLSDEVWRARLAAYRKGKAPNLRVRPNCPADPAERKVIRRKLRERAIELKRAGAAGVSLAREPALAPRGGGIDLCLCPGCREWTVRELRKRYTKTENVGRSWGIHVPSWEGLVPLPLDECPKQLSGGRTNLTAWCDHRSEIDSSWVDSLAWMRLFAKEFGGNLPVGFVGGRSPEASAGYDWGKMLAWPDWAAPPGDDLTSLLARSVNRNGVPLLGVVDRPGTAGKQQLWRAVIAGRAGLVLSSEAARDESLWKEARFAARGTGELTRVAVPDDAGVGLYWSHRSLQVRTALGWRPEGSARAWIGHLARLGVTPRIVTPGGLERVRPSGLKALILPEAVSISQREAALIRDFAHGGGFVIADRACGLFDGPGRELPDKGGLDELFGIGRTAEAPKKTAARPARLHGVKPPDPTDGVSVSRLKVAEGNVRAVTSYPRARAGGAECVLLREAGRGKACYLNLEFSDGSSADEAKLAANLLELAGVGRQMPVWSGDEVVPDCLRYRYSLGSAQVVIAWAPRISRPRIAVVGLKRSLFVYDATDGVFIGQTSRPQLELRADRPAVLVCFEQQASAVDLKLTERGNRIAWHASLERDPQRTDRVFHLEVISPAGEVLPHYSRTVVARRGRASGTFTPAANEPVGAWSARITDVATGNTVTATFLKREIRFDGLFPIVQKERPRRRRRR